MHATRSLRHRSRVRGHSIAHTRDLTAHQPENCATVDVAPDPELADDQAGEARVPMGLVAAGGLGLLLVVGAAAASGGPDEL